MSRIVHIHVKADCAECGLSHGHPGFVNGKRGMVIGRTPSPTNGHTVKVGIVLDGDSLFQVPDGRGGWQPSSFQYFHPDELTDADDSA